MFARTRHLPRVKIVRVLLYQITTGLFVLSQYCLVHLQRCDYFPNVILNYDLGVVKVLLRV